MRKMRFGAVMLVAMLAVGLGGCHRLHPIYTVENHPVPAAAQKLPLNTIEKTIIDAALSRGWTVEQVQPGLLRATEKWREHSATVDIRYSERSYAITYVGSNNLKAGDGYIHRRYNSLVMALEEEIEKRLHRLSL